MSMRRFSIALLLAACTTTPRGGMQFGATEGSPDGTRGTDGPEQGDTTKAATSGASTGADETSWWDDESDGGIFDVAGPSVPPDNGVIPKTCERAEDGESTQPRPRRVAARPRPLHFPCSTNARAASISSLTAPLRSSASRATMASCFAVAAEPRAASARARPRRERARSSATLPGASA